MLKKISAQLEFWILALCLLLALIWAYAPSLQGTFLWDDNRYITENVLVKNPQGLWGIWSSFQEIVNYWPVTNTAFWLQYQAWGPQAAFFRWVNLAFHFGNALLIYFLFKRFQFNHAHGLALLFAIHPLAVESVAWISELKNVLSFSLILGCLLSYQKWLLDSRPLWFGLACLLAALALLSKSAAVIIAAVLFLLHHYYRPHWSWQTLRALLPFFAMAILSSFVFLYEEHAKQTQELYEVTYTYLERWMIALQSYFFYLKQVIWPHPLMTIYPLWSGVVFSWSTSWAWLCLFIAIVFILRGIQLRKRAALLLLAYSYLAVLPALGFFVHQMSDKSHVADHYFYYSIPAVLALLIMVAERLYQQLCQALQWQRQGGSAKLGFNLILLLIALALTLQTHQISKVYHDATQYWEHNYRENPQSWFVVFSLGDTVLANLGCDPAMPWFSLGMELKPDFPPFYHNRGICYIDKKDYHNGIKDLDQALQYHNKYIKAYYHRALALNAIGEKQKAKRDLEQAIQIYPKYNKALWVLATLQFETGEYSQVLTQLERLEQLEVNLPVIDMLKAQSLAKLERNQEALDLLHALLDKNPQIASAYLESAQIYAKHKQFDQALLVLSDALQVLPKNAQLWLAQGQYQWQAQQTSQACVSWDQACRNGLCETWQQALRESRCKTSPQP